jgi:parallel beta-helix repeat protein
LEEWLIMRGVLMIFAATLLSVGASFAASAAEFHVSPDGLDSNAGDQVHPFATIGQAVAMAKSGDTIWLNSGIYRESIDLKTPGAEPLTISAAPGEKPHIFGSVALAGPWQKLDDDVFSMTWPANTNTAGWLFIDDGPASLNPGTAPQKPGEYVLKSVGTNPAQLVVKFDPGDQPSRHHLEWATAHAVIVAESNAYPVHLKGLDVAYANNGKQEAVVGLYSPGSIVENCVIRDSTSRGVSIVNNGTVEGCHVYAHGILGIGSGGGDTEGVRDMRVINCEIDHNAWNKADLGWEAGGIKLSSARDAIVSGNRIHDNQAWGIWFDWQCVGNRIEGNSCQRNVGGGIFLEASRGRNFIVNNICTDTRQAPGNDWGDGIFSHDSSDALVAHNLCLHNAAFGIRFRLDSDRKLADGRRMECARNVIVNNICADNGVGQLALPSEAPLMHGNVSDGNVLFAENTSEHLVQASIYPKLPFFDLPGWQRLGFDRHSIEALPLFHDSNHGDFHPAAKAPQAGIDPTLAAVLLDFDGKSRHWPVTTAGPFESTP